MKWLSLWSERSVDHKAGYVDNEVGIFQVQRYHIFLKKPRNPFLFHKTEVVFNNNVIIIVKIIGSFIDFMYFC